MSRSKNRKKKQQRANQSALVTSEAARADSAEAEMDNDDAAEETATTLHQTSEVLRDAADAVLAGTTVVAAGEVELNESAVRATPPVAQVEAAAKAGLNGHDDLLADLPADVFTPLEIDFFRRAEELYTVSAFDNWEDLDGGEEEQAAEERHTPTTFHARHSQA